jgi:hypothetical protein
MTCRNGLVVTTNLLAPPEMLDLQTGWFNYYGFDYGYLPATASEKLLKNARPEIRAILQGATSEDPMNVMISGQFTSHTTARGIAVIQSCIPSTTQKEIAQALEREAKADAEFKDAVDAYNRGLDSKNQFESAVNKWRAARDAVKELAGFTVSATTHG